MASTKTLTFKVTRKNLELIPPAKPTPHEFKPLSDIDDQDGLRFQIPLIHFYRKNPLMEGKDSVDIIRAAVAKALVFYYPFAGRLREFSGRKLVVECTGEGVVFIEADADVALRQFGDNIYPPFPCVEELLYDVPGTSGVINSPLLLIQVTRLKCGGFIFAVRLNHTMSDATGIVQFMSAVGKLARGSDTPFVAPVWERHLLTASHPPRVTCKHREYGDGAPNTKQTPLPSHNLVHRSFLFRSIDISALRRSLRPHLSRHCSSFELVTACAWRCRTIALSPNPNEEIQFACIVNCRKRLNPPLPEGYYGNAIVYPAAGKLLDSPLHYAVELVRKAKAEATEEYVKSVADMMVIRGRPHFTTAGTYLVPGLTHMGMGDVDLGWGPAAYGGPAKGGIDPAPGVVSFILPFKYSNNNNNNNESENGIVVPICLPLNAMEVFVKELEMMMVEARRSSFFHASAL